MQRKERKLCLLQYGAAIAVAAYTAGGSGMIISWTSPALEYLNSNKSDFPITKDEISWVAPLLPIGINIGALLIPIIINQFDRKWISLIFFLPQFISWILIIKAKNILSIYIARIFGGIGYGGGLCAMTVFLSEIVTPENRGIFLSFPKLFLSLGIFITMLISAYFPYDLMNFTILGIISFLFFIFLFMPNSTYFLKKAKQKEEEIQMLNLPNVEDIKKKNPKLDPLPKEGSNPRFNLKIKESTFWKFITIQANRRAFSILIVCCALDVFSGHSVVRYFSNQIFKYNKSFLTPEKSSLLLAGVKCIAALISIQVIERFRRKVLLLITVLLGSLGMGLVGLFFFLEYCKVDVFFITWLPVFGICLYDSMLTIGIGNFLYLYLGELFPNDLRGLAITLGSQIYMLFSFLSIWQYQILVELVHPCIIFWIFSVSNVIIAFILLKITPETKGKSIEEVQILLKSTNLF